jgi:hypothetical protein
MTVGTLDSNEVVVDADGVSRVHAVFERFGDTWCVRDSALATAPLALCRPLLTGDAFTEPASIRAIAAELVVSEAAVKQHLSRLYGKFDVGAHGERRRVQLANAAVSTGAVKLSDLRPRA